MNRGTVKFVFGFSVTVLLLGYAIGVHDDAGKPSYREYVEMYGMQPTTDEIRRPPWLRRFSAVARGALWVALLVSGAHLLSTSQGMGSDTGGDDSP